LNSPPVSQSASEQVSKSTNQQTINPPISLFTLQPIIQGVPPCPKNS
jgi:hypothetical protein